VGDVVLQEADLFLRDVDATTAKRQFRRHQPRHELTEAGWSVGCEWLFG
jgi:hypothetical protein